jgi:hypothetical protein
MYYRLSDVPCLPSFIHFIYIHLFLRLNLNLFHSISQLRLSKVPTPTPTMSYHIPYTPSRLNPSFPLPLQFIPSQFPPVPQPFPSPPIIVGGGRFGKRKLSVIQGQGQGRGTMSMPTSPLRQSVNTEVWQGVSLILTIILKMMSCGADDSLIQLLHTRVNLYVQPFLHSSIIGVELRTDNSPRTSTFTQHKQSHHSSLTVQSHLLTMSTITTMTMTMTMTKETQGKGMMSRHQGRKGHK